MIIYMDKTLIELKKLDNELSIESRKIYYKHIIVSCDICSEIVTHILVYTNYKGRGICKKHYKDLEPILYDGMMDYNIIDVIEL